MPERPVSTHSTSSFGFNDTDRPTDQAEDGNAAEEVVVRRRPKRASTGGFNGAHEGFSRRGSVYAGFDDEVAGPAQTPSGGIVYGTTADSGDVATPYATVTPDEVHNKFRDVAAAFSGTDLTDFEETERPTPDDEFVVTDAAGRPLAPIQGGTLKKRGSGGSWYRTIDRKSKSKHGAKKTEPAFTEAHRSEQSSSLPAVVRKAESPDPWEEISPTNSPTASERGFGFLSSTPEDGKTDSGVASVEVDLAGEPESLYNSTKSLGGDRVVDMVGDLSSPYNVTTNTEASKMTWLYAESPITTPPDSKSQVLYDTLDDFSPEQVAVDVADQSKSQEQPPQLPPRNINVLAAQPPRAASNAVPQMPDFTALSPFQQRRKKSLDKKGSHQTVPPPLELRSPDRSTPSTDSGVISPKEPMSPTQSPKKLPEGERGLAMLAKLYIQRRDAFLGGSYPCVRATAAKLAAYQLLIEVDATTPVSRVDPRSVLPLLWAGAKGIEKAISDAKLQLAPANESEYKLRYVQLIQCLPTHGATVFTVAERIVGKTKAIPRLLAVGVRRLMILEIKTQAVITTYSTLNVRRWRSAIGVVTIDLEDDVSLTQLVFETSDPDRLSSELAEKLSKCRGRTGSVGTPIVDASRPLSPGTVRSRTSSSRGLDSTMAVLRSCVEGSSAGAATVPARLHQESKKGKRGALNKTVSGSKHRASSTIRENSNPDTPARARFDILQGQMTMLRSKASERNKAFEEADVPRGGRDSPDPRHSPQVDGGVDVSSPTWDGGAWLYTQLADDIQAARRSIHGASKLLRSGDGIRTKSDPEWRKVNFTTALGHITRHCNAVREAIDALTDILQALHTSTRDSVDYTNIGSWVGTLGQHVPSLARNTKLYAALAPFSAHRDVLRQCGTAVCEALKGMLKGLWRTLQPSVDDRLATVGTSKAKSFSQRVQDSQNKINILMHQVYASRDTGSKIRAAADAAKNFTFSDETGGEELYDNPAELLERSGFSADSRGGLGEDEIDDLDDP